MPSQRRKPPFGFSTFLHKAKLCQSSPDDTDAKRLSTTAPSGQSIADAIWLLRSLSVRFGEAVLRYALFSVPFPQHFGKVEISTEATANGEMIFGTFVVTVSETILIGEYSVRENEADALKGTVNNDYIFGGEANDFLIGLPNNDSIAGSNNVEINDSNDNILILLSEVNID